MKKYVYLEDFGLTVFEDGEVFTARGKKVSSKPCRQGYHRVFYPTKDGRKNIGLHRLVAIAFIPNPENKSDVNHKDGNKSNNGVSNLEWMTRKENLQHAYDTGLMKDGLKKKRKLARHKLVRELVKSGYKREVLADAFGVSETIINNIINHQDHFIDDDIAS